MSFVFFDTNVLVYAFAPNSDPAKAARAEAVLKAERNRAAVSAQVLGEFYSVLKRKSQPPIADGDLNRMMAALLRFHVEPIDSSLTQVAVQLQQASQLNYWDALIVEAAKRCGAEILYTEDMQHGQIFGSLRTINPFL